MKVFPRFTKMHCTILVVILTLLTFQESQQTCFVVNSYRAYYSILSRMLISKYVQCEKEMLSADFSKKVKSLNIPVEWLEINNTDSPEIASGAFSHIPSVANLLINNAGVRILQDDCFQNLKQLKKLSLKNNRIGEISNKVFKNLSMLIELDLSFNSIVNLDKDSFKGLLSLESLILQNNFLTQLPANLFTQSWIKKLDLSFNKLLQIDNLDLKSQGKLDTLIINNNNLNSFEFTKFPSDNNLRYIYLNNNNIKTLNNICFPKGLQILNVSNNRIESLNCSCYSVIHSLDLSQNTIGNIKNLSFKNISVFGVNLDQNYIGLSQIENDALNNLTSIEVLSLSNNQIKKLSPLLFKYNKKLRKLNLSKNYLTSSLNTTFPLSLEELNISRNNIDSTLNISNLLNLKNLDLSYNNFKEVSFNSLRDLKFLLQLDLSSNKITKINLGAFRDLKFMRTLNLSSNDLADLPLGAFLGLDALYSMDLSNNRLADLNEGLFHNLRLLQTLNLNYNNISYDEVDSILAHNTFTLRQIGLAGNGWHCNMLTTLLKQYRRIQIANAGSYDSTNVDGVACEYKETVSNTQTNFEKSMQIMVSRLFSTNVILILILLILILTLVLQFVNSYVSKKLKEKMSRFHTIQEIQLMN